jgi:hypothetical protein
MVANYGDDDDDDDDDDTSTQRYGGNKTDS